jgi:hypothetical protein
MEPCLHAQGKKTRMTVAQSGMLKIFSSPIPVVSTLLIVHCPDLTNTNRSSWPLQRHYNRLLTMYTLHALLFYTIMERGVTSFPPRWSTKQSHRHRHHRTTGTTNKPIPRAMVKSFSQPPRLRCMRFPCLSVTLPTAHCFAHPFLILPPDINTVTDSLHRFIHFLIRFDE